MQLQNKIFLGFKLSIKSWKNKLPNNLQLNI